MKKTNKKEVADRTVLTRHEPSAHSTRATEKSHAIEKRTETIEEHFFRRKIHLTLPGQGRPIKHQLEQGTNDKRDKLGY